MCTHYTHLCPGTSVVQYFNFLRSSKESSTVAPSCTQPIPSHSHQKPPNGWQAEAPPLSFINATPEHNPSTKRCLFVPEDQRLNIPEETLVRPSSSCCGTCSEVKAGLYTNNAGTTLCSVYIHFFSHCMPLSLRSLLVRYFQDLHERGSDLCVAGYGENAVIYQHK